MTETGKAFPAVRQQQRWGCALVRLQCMAIRILRLGTKRAPEEGLRIVAVRWPRCGVPNQAYALPDRPIHGSCRILIVEIRSWAIGQ